MEDLEWVLILQCQIAHRRCSGWACTKAFYDRTGAFKDYPEGTRYLSFTCGGCCGKGAAAKLEHFLRKSKIPPQRTAVHLSSCMTTDNHHYDRCPSLEYIKTLVAKKGFSRIVEGSYISAKAEQRRSQGLYRTYGADSL